MKKTFTISLIFFFLLFLPLAQAKIEVSYLFWGVIDEINIIRQLKVSFEKNNPEITIKLIHANSFDEKLKTMMAAGTPPDIFYLDYKRLPFFAEQGIVLDITDYIKKDKTIQLKDFFPATTAAFEYQGKIYGIPKDFTPMVVYYNKDLFDKYQVPYPEEGWTWGDLLEKAQKLTHDINGDGELDEFGFAYGSWIEFIAPFIWQNGGAILNRERTKCLFDSREVTEAIKFLHDLRYQYRVSPSDATAPGMDSGQMFFSGRIAMHGPYGRWLVPQFRNITKFRWEVAVLPLKKTQASCIATVALAIAKGSKHPQAAYKVLSYMTGKGGQDLNSRLGLAVPSIREVAYTDAFISTKDLPYNDKAYLDSAAYSKTIPVTIRWPEMERILNQELSACLDLNKKSPAEACQAIASQVNKVFGKKTDANAPTISARVIKGIFIGLGIIIILFIMVGLIKGRKLSPLAKIEERKGFLFISPWLIGLLAFTLGPIIISLLLSLCQWSGLESILQAKFVLFKNFAEVFHDFLFWKSLKVTLLYTGMAVPLGIGAALFVAMLLNQKIQGIKYFRTIYYLPSVVSGVAVAVLWLWIFHPKFGILNFVLGQLGINGPYWLQSDSWALPAIVIMGLWGIGGAMLTYLAGLQNIPPHLYEAARIDGANKWSQFWNITLPLLSPVIFFNLIMGIIGSFQVFTQAYVMTAGGPNYATYFYGLYIFNKAFNDNEMGYGCALAWILFIIIFICTLIVFKSSAAWVYYEGEKKR